MTGTPEVVNGSGNIPRFALDPGPVSEVHAFWLAGMSCDGCSISIVGAQQPSVEQLLLGSIPGLPKVILHHPVLSVAVGKEFMKPHHLAKAGKLGAPYVVIYEGSVADESIAGAELSLSIDASQLYLFDPETGSNLLHAAAAIA